MLQKYASEVVTDITAPMVDWSMFLAAPGEPESSRGAQGRERPKIESVDLTLGSSEFASFGLGPQVKQLLKISHIL